MDEYFLYIKWSKIKNSRLIHLKRCFFKYKSLLLLIFLFSGKLNWCDCFDAALFCVKYFFLFYIDVPSNILTFFCFMVFWLVKHEHDIYYIYVFIKMCNVMWQFWMILRGEFRQTAMWFGNSLLPFLGDILSWTIFWLTNK